jgi:hypothetical protein
VVEDDWHAGVGELAAQGVENSCFFAVMCAHLVIAALAEGSAGLEETAEARQAVHTAALR